MRPLLVGLTGGVASGKSTVSQQFERLGVPVIDADVIAREVVQPGRPALEAIRDAFGADVIAADGSLDRATMRRRVFSVASERRRLEGILHPLIRQRMFDQATQCDYPYCILAIPLLVEAGMADQVDRVLVVDVDEQTQVARLTRRDDISDDQARQMLRAQASREDRLAVADDVIDNSGPLSALETRVRQLHEDYLRLAARRPK